MAIGEKGQALSAKGMVACGFVLAAFFAVEVRAERENGLPPRERARLTYGALVPEVLAGEVVLKTEVTKVTVAIDVAGPDGRGDGRVDHVFSYLTLRPTFTPIALWDPSAEIEVRPTGLRLFAHTQQKEFELLINGVPPSPRPKVPAYPVKVFEVGVQLYRYSGQVVEHLSLADVDRKGAEVMRPIHGDRIEKLFPQNPTPPNPDSDASCQPSCSSKGCGTGACSAACNPGRCAKCECVGDPPPTYPLCYCV